MRLMLCLLATGVLTVACAWTSTLAGEREQRAAVAMSGSWDMSKSPHRFSTYMVIRRAGGMYPSFWAGLNDSGRVTIRAAEDVLTGDLAVSVSGPFSVTLNRAARKQGMAEKMPGGVWAAGLGESPIVVTFSGFSGWTVEGVYSAKEDRGVTLGSRFTGELSVGDQRTAITGECGWRFSEVSQQFSLTAAFTFTGSSMGLGGENAGELRVRLHAKSAMSTTRPTAPTMDDDLGGGPPKPGDGALPGPGLPDADDLPGLDF